VSNYARDLIYKKDRPVTPPQVVNVVDLGYLGVGKDYPDQPSSHYHIKRRKTKISPRRNRV
jgi:hypothetical protein